MIIFSFSLRLKAFLVPLSCGFANMFASDSLVVDVVAMILVSSFIPRLGVLPPRMGGRALLHREQQADPLPWGAVI
jgi:hypothetical protein